MRGWLDCRDRQGLRAGEGLGCLQRKLGHGGAQHKVGMQGKGGVRGGGEGLA